MYTAKRDHYPGQSSLRALTTQHFAIRGGRSWKRTAYRCTPSRAHLNSSGLKSETRYFVSLQHTSLYRRLIIANTEEGAITNTSGRELYKRLILNPKEGTTLLKFRYGQLFIGKIAQRFGHAPPVECPLCHKPQLI